MNIYMAFRYNPKIPIQKCVMCLQLIKLNTYEYLEENVYRDIKENSN